MRSSLSALSVWFGDDILNLLLSIKSRGCFTIGVVSWVNVTKSRVGFHSVFNSRGALILLVLEGAPREAARSKPCTENIHFQEVRKIGRKRTRRSMKRESAYLTTRLRELEKKIILEACARMRMHDDNAPPNIEQDPKQRSQQKQEKQGIEKPSC